MNRFHVISRWQMLGLKATRLPELLHSATIAEMQLWTLHGWACLCANKTICIDIWGLRNSHVTRQSSLDSFVCLNDWMAHWLINRQPAGQVSTETQLLTLLKTRLGSQSSLFSSLCVWGSCAPVVSVTGWKVFLVAGFSLDSLRSSNPHSTVLPVWSPRRRRTGAHSSGLELLVCLGKWLLKWMTRHSPETQSVYHLTQAHTGTSVPVDDLSL